MQKEEGVAMHIKRFIRKITASSKSEALLVECYPAVAEYIRDTFLPAWKRSLKGKYSSAHVPRRRGANTASTVRGRSRRWSTA